MLLIFQSAPTYLANNIQNKKYKYTIQISTELEVSLTGYRII